MKTAEEYWYEHDDEHLVTIDGKSFSVNEWSMMEAYARYYHEQKLLELTDEKIQSKYWTGKQTRATSQMYEMAATAGARWAKQFYLKNNK